MGWPILLALSYCFGAIVNHNLFLAIHELSSNLGFWTAIYNRFLGLFANLPISIPMAIMFQKYHLEHHSFQGVEDFDTDIPSYAEGHVVSNICMKILWVICQLLFCALWPLFLYCHLEDFGSETAKQFLFCTSKEPFSDQSAVVILQDSANLLLFVRYQRSTTKPQMGRLIDFSYQNVGNLCEFVYNLHQ
jgi:hypothetical protein